MSKKRGEGDSDKLLLKKSVRKKIDYLKKKPRVDPIKAYNLIKDFFRAFTGNEVEYTREELVEELDKFYLEEGTKMRVSEIIRKLGRVEFSNPQFSEDEVENMLEDFYQAVDTMVTEETKHLNFWDKMVKKIKSHLKKHEEEEEKEEDTPISRFVQEADQEIEREPEMEEAVEKTREVKEEKIRERRRQQTRTSSVQDLQKEYNQKQSEKELEFTEEQEHGASAEEEFEDLLQTFREDLNEGDVMMAKLDYEELRHVYDVLGDDAKNRHYDELKKSYDDLNQVL